MRRIAVRFARSADYLPTRTKYQLPTLDSSQVRTLSVQQGDGTTCTKLLQLVQAKDGVLAGSGFRLTFFQAGTHYYVVGVGADAVDPPPPGVIRLGWGTLWVVTGGGKQTVLAKIGV